MASRFARPVLACGAELKNTFCLGREDRAFLSHHIGDLENYETLRSFTDGIGHFRRLFDVTPQIVAHDLHPEYLSTKYALEQDGCVLAGVQHHHAHIASCLADNGEAGPVIGVAFDGTGYGTDGTIWGGEFLLADLADAERAGHLAGGADARRRGRDPPALADGRRLPGRRLPGAACPAAWTWRRGISEPGRPCSPWPAAAMNSPADVQRRAGCSTRSPRCWACATPSTTRARPRSSWSSWPPRHAHDPYPAAITDGRPFTVAGPDLVRAAAEDLLAGVPPGDHRRPVPPAAWPPMIGEACGLLRERSGLGTVALSGGVFQNLLCSGPWWTCWRAWASGS